MQDYTLIEAAKMLPQAEDQRAALVQIFAEETDLLRVMPMDNIIGPAVTYNQEETLPGVAFRGVNEGYVPDVGVINPQTDVLVIVGGDLDVDNFILQTMGEKHRSVQEGMKSKRLAHVFSHTWIKGDSSVNPKEFDGLQVRLTGNQVVDAGATSGGDALSLAKLDEAIDRVDNPTHLLMSKGMRRKLAAASRAGVTGDVTYDHEEIGRRVQFYADLPILIADGNGDVYSTLAFDEANPGGGANVGTSIYVLSLGLGKLSGIQNSIPRVTDLGEVQDKPVKRTRLEWYVGMALFHPRAASRLRGIKDVAIVA